MTWSWTASRVSFIVPGLPVPWARSRVDPRRQRWTVDHRGKLKRQLSQKAFYHPGAQSQHMKLVQAHASAAMRGRKPIEGPVVATMVFVFPRPKSRAKKMGVGRRPMLNKPDQSNLEKLVEDACNRIVYRDDRQLFMRGESSAKWYAAEHEEPHTEVVFEEWCE